MTKIRLKRIGRKNDMTYRIVVSDSRNTPRGQNTEEIGYFDPMHRTEKPLFINEESALKWLKNGARPSESVLSLLKETGLWAKFLETKTTATKQTKKEAKENNKTSGKAKAKARANKVALEEARIQRHKAKRLAKRADKQPTAEQAE